MRLRIFGIARQHVAAWLLACASAPAVLGAEEPPEPAITPAELALVKEAEAARVAGIAKVYGAVVAVYGNDRQGGGSGVLVHSAGLALTNHHVMQGAGSEGWGGLADGKLYRWRLVGTDPGGDVALIQLRGRTDFPTAPLGDSTKVRVGDWALAMGNPFTLAEDQKPTVTLGIVSGVDRYQAGAGENTLVYGRCLQVDSSINPGNSGGPLFTLRGGLIGINGRGSFEERGRVNVGAGYAIALEQIVKFMPDLYATKLAQHGTLDAVFGNRERGVVCHTLNLDARAAQDGLALGDRLLEFEGEAIRDANQFTNLVSTLPAEWPVKLLVDRNGEQRTVLTRLVALPYAEENEEAPPDEKKKEPAPGERPAKKPGPKPAAAAHPRPSFGKPGQVRDEELNRQHAGDLLTSARRNLAWDAWPADVKGCTLRDELRRGKQVVGQETIVLAADGRYRIDYTLDGVSRTFACDGRRTWSLPASEKPAAERMYTDPLAAEAAVLAALVREWPAAERGALTLEGGDKALGVPAYRLKITSPQKRELFLWLRVLDAAGQFSPRLLKLGGSLDGAAPLAHVRFGAWSPVEQVLLPERRDLVSGLGETVLLEIVPTAREVVRGEIPASTFAPPAAADAKKE